MQSYKKNHEEREIISLNYVFLNYMTNNNPAYNLIMIINGICLTE